MQSKTENKDLSKRCFTFIMQHKVASIVSTQIIKLKDDNGLQVSKGSMELLSHVEKGKLMLILTTNNKKNSICKE
jgi:hypothetical protein